MDIDWTIITEEDLIEALSEAIWCHRKINRVKAGVFKDLDYDTVEFMIREYDLINNRDFLEDYMDDIKNYYKKKYGRDED